jgi:hypothetical protein
MRLCLAGALNPAGPAARGFGHRIHAHFADVGLDLINPWAGRALQPPPASTGGGPPHWPRSWHNTAWRGGKSRSTVRQTLVRLTLR